MDGDEAEFEPGRPSLVPCDSTYLVTWEGESVPLLPLLSSDGESPFYGPICRFSAQLLRETVMPVPLANVWNDAHDDPLFAESFWSFYRVPDHLVSPAAKSLVFTLCWRALMYTGHGKMLGDDTEFLGQPAGRRYDRLHPWSDLEKCHNALLAMESFVSGEDICWGANKRTRAVYVGYQWVPYKQLPKKAGTDLYDHLPDIRGHERLHNFLARLLALMLTQYNRTPDWVRIKARA